MLGNFLNSHYDVGDTIVKRFYVRKVTGKHRAFISSVACIIKERIFLLNALVHSVLRFAKKPAWGRTHRAKQMQLRGISFPIVARRCLSMISPAYVIIPCWLYTGRYYISNGNAIVNGHRVGINSKHPRSRLANAKRSRDFLPQEKPHLDFQLLHR